MIENRKYDQETADQAAKQLDSFLKKLSTIDYDACNRLRTFLSKQITSIGDLENHQKTITLIITQVLKQKPNSLKEEETNPNFLIDLIKRTGIPRMKQIVCSCLLEDKALSGQKNVNDLIH